MHWLRLAIRGSEDSFVHPEPEMGRFNKVYIRLTATVDFLYLSSKRKDLKKSSMYSAFAFMC